VLATSDVEFVVVGALAAVVQGAPLVTSDVDIVHRRTPENVRRLVAVLVNQLDARYRGQFDRILRPTEETLTGTGHSLLQTKLGPLDVLGAIEGGRDYDVLRPRSLRVELEGHAVYVLGLEAIVEIKRGSTRRKDQLALPVLEETLRRSSIAPDESDEG
jgi:hypothetical protein